MFGQNMDKTLYFGVLLILSVSIFSCTKKSTIVIEENIPKYSSAELLEKLETIYSEKDTLKLLGFFKEWNETVKPNSEASYNSDKNLSEVYAVFKAVYEPLSSRLIQNLMGESRHRNPLADKKPEYVLVQNTVDYVVFDPEEYEDGESLKTMKIVNFKPRINFDEERILYVTNEYSNALGEFFGSQYYNSDRKEIVRANPEKFKRYPFFEKYLDILRSDWGGSIWYFETPPGILYIVLYSDFAKAQVFYRFGYKESSINLVKENEQWMIK